MKRQKYVRGVLYTFSFQQSIINVLNQFLEEHSWISYVHMHKANIYFMISLPEYLNLLDHWTIAICFLIQIYSMMCCMLVVTNENLKYSLNRQINLSSTTQIHCLYTLTSLLHITSLLYYLTMVLHDFRIKWDKNLDVMLW